MGSYLSYVTITDCTMVHGNVQVSPDFFFFMKKLILMQNSEHAKSIKNF